jgi:hypothetical protein
MKTNNSKPPQGRKMADKKILENRVSGTAKAAEDSAIRRAINA